MDQIKNIEWFSDKKNRSNSRIVIQFTDDIAVAKIKSEELFKSLKSGQTNEILKVNILKINQDSFAYARL